MPRSIWNAPHARAPRLADPSSGNPPYYPTILFVRTGAISTRRLRWIKIGLVLAQLEKDGLPTTLVAFFGDMARRTSEANSSATTAACSCLSSVGHRKLTRRFQTRLVTTASHLARLDRHHAFIACGVQKPANMQAASSRPRAEPSRDIVFGARDRAMRRGSPPHRARRPIQIHSQLHAGSPLPARNDYKINIAAWNLIKN